MSYEISRAIFEQRAAARAAGAKWKLVQPEVYPKHGYREFYFRTNPGAQAYWEGEGRKEGTISELK